MWVESDYTCTSKQVYLSWRPSQALIDQRDLDPRIRSTSIDRDPVPIPDYCHTWENMSLWKSRSFSEKYIKQESSCESTFFIPFLPRCLIMGLTFPSPVMTTRWCVNFSHPAKGTSAYRDLEPIRTSITDSDSRFRLSGRRFPQMVIRLPCHPQRIPN
jgi:hypothetical protein